MRDESLAAESQATATGNLPRRIGARCVRFARQSLQWTSVAALSYAAIVLVGLIPVNNDFRPADYGITIYVVSSAVHADIVVPRRSDIIDWDKELGSAALRGGPSDDSHLAIGWGDRGFYLETPAWSDLKVSTLANALFLPSRTCVHVTYVRPEYFVEARKVTISREQYRRLAAYLRDSLERDADGRVLQIAGYAYANNDAFFEARGSYHLFNTCNSWAGRALQSAGVKTPWYSPWPGTPALYLPNPASRG